jgi:L-alanine-DL-glutamate epimerase-like enolase superfamily enzyme
MMRIVDVETYIVTIPRDVPYLGPLASGEFVNSRGYVVRRGNGTIYPTVDRSIVIRVRTDDNIEGWGETYGICAPYATCEIIHDLLVPVLKEIDVADSDFVWDTLYGLVRVRGGGTGFFGDALAALDIALWDVRAKRAGCSVAELLGSPLRSSIPCYLSGLPVATLGERVALAKHWFEQGISAFKFAAVVSHEGVEEEMQSLRRALGAEAELMVDLHWKYTAAQALDLARALAPERPLFIEAPVKPEDALGLAKVCATSPIPVAAGEEWYNEYEFANRACEGLAFVQPEMAHTGITQFVRIAKAARGLQIAPHATIGVGIFLAASLQASCTLPNLWRHEWQHSVFERTLGLLDTTMSRDGMHYQLPRGKGLGVEPNARFWQYSERVR